MHGYTQTRTLTCTDTHRHGHGHTQIHTDTRADLSSEDCSTNNRLLQPPACILYTTELLNAEQPYNNLSLSESQHLSLPPTTRFLKDSEGKRGEPVVSSAAAAVPASGATARGVKHSGVHSSIHPLNLERMIPSFAEAIENRSALLSPCAREFLSVPFGH